MVWGTTPDQTSCLVQVVMHLYREALEKVSLASPKRPALPVCVPHLPWHLGLCVQVVMHLYREALEKVPLFRGKPPQFITSLVTFLKLEYYSPGGCV